MARTHITIDMRWERAERTLVECFRDAPTGNVSDAAGRVVGLPNVIKPIPSAYRFCGTALTIDNGRMGNLGVWAALEYIRPGDVIVIATGEAKERAVIGDLDGVVVVPQAKLASSVGALTKITEKERAMDDQVRAGGKVPVEALAILAATEITRLEN